VLAGTLYEMATVPRWYVPVYILVRLPMITLLGAALATVLTVYPRLTRSAERAMQRRETAFITFAVIFPLACQVIGRGPAFTGLRHFLFVVPLLSILAGIGFDILLHAFAQWRRDVAIAASAMIAACLLLDAGVLVRLHPHEYLFYNELVGGLEGASGRYVTDYWVNIMPEAVKDLENVLQAERPGAHDYTVAVCGEKLPFEKRPHANLLWTPDWPKADFFIAPTHMHCDKVLAGKTIATIERLGVPIGLVKDRRAITRPGLAQIQSTTRTTQ
jgi:hypothetical protein